MGVRKIRTKWWVDFRFDGIRYRKRSPENTREGAQIYQSTLQRRLALGQSLNIHPVPKLKEFAPKWIRTYVLVNNKYSELITKRSILLRTVIPFFGEYKLDEIQSYDVEKYKAQKLAEGLSQKTINNHLMVLSKCLNTAVNWLIIEKVPKIQLFKVFYGPATFLNATEIECLIANAEEPVRAMIITACYTGMRVGELLGLEWKNIDIDRKIIVVEKSLVKGRLTTPKNGKTRVIPLSPVVVTALSGLNNKGKYVFRTTGDPKCAYHFSYRCLQKICKKARVRSVGWHIFRHSFASHLVTGGAPIRAVQLLLGHSTVEMTERYAHLAPSFLHETLGILEGQLKTSEIEKY